MTTRECGMADRAETKVAAEAGEERHEFQAEVSRLLNLMVHSVYSEKDVFLRELISNASDACDKLRYEALTQPALIEDDARFRVLLAPDAAARTLTVADNGVGMSKGDLIENLGTIARSGTLAFVERLAAEAGRKGDAGKKGEAPGLIGQFGVGFYAAFMVAERIEVVSRRAGTAETWLWQSDGAGSFTVRRLPDDDPALGHLIAARGTAVVLHLREGEDAFLDPANLRRVVKTYSDHIGLPIELRAPKDEVKDGKAAEGDDAAAAPEVINAASALWTLPRRGVTEDQYREFYRHVAHAFDDPWLTIHYRAEGKIEYSVLLFVPGSRPFDLFDPLRQPRVRLYVRRVYITDDAPVLPAYLRFLRGVVDSEDMPLNLSREMLQNNPLVAKINQAVAKRVLGELAKKAESDPESYAAFWRNFGAVLKEALYEDPDRREEVLALARFRTTRSGEGFRSLKDYLADMVENQTAIYFITGDDPAALARSPQVEGYAARGVEVLLLSDPIDDFWTAAAEGYDGKPFRSVTKGAADLANLAPAASAEAQGEAAPDAAMATLIALVRQTLGDAVQDVRRSERLTDSPVCLVAGEGGLDLHLERLLARHGEGAGMKAERILELNPRHPLIRTLAERAGQGGAADALTDAAWLPVDQARVLEGEPPADPAAFSRRMTDVLARAFG
jgi:molecular chaperone HtpG